jgi:hypothetical protein
MKVVIDIEKLNKKQTQFIKDHALELFAATMLPPNDEPTNILNSTCSCCKARRAFLQRILDLEE